MTFYELRYMLAIADTGSVSKAAETLYMAQSSLSQFLSRYEARLGVRLFTRTSQGMVPTAAGRMYIQAAREILDIAQRFRRDIDQMLKNDVKKTIRFGISPYRTPLVLPELPELLHQKYPNVQITVVEENATRLENMLLESGIDCAVVGLPLAHPELPYTVIKCEDIILGCSKGHPVSRCAHTAPDGRQWLDFEDILRYPLIMLDKNSRIRKILDPMIGSYCAHPHVVQQTSNVLTAIDLAKKGVGLTFLPDAFVRRANLDMALFTVGEAPLTRSLVMVFPPRAVIDGLYSELAASMRQIMA